MNDDTRSMVVAALRAAADSVEAGRDDERVRGWFRNDYRDESSATAQDARDATDDVDETVYYYDPAPVSWGVVVTVEHSTQPEMRPPGYFHDAEDWRAGIDPKEETYEMRMVNAWEVSDGR